MTDNSPALPSGLIDGIKENAKLAVISGVILIIAGTFAVMSPLVVGLSITIMVGVSLVIGGVGQCFLALKSGAFGRGLWTLVVGALMVIAGVFMMTQPVAGLASITLLLVAYLVAAGLTELFVALQLRPADGWGLMLFNGIVTLLLGAVLVTGFGMVAGAFGRDFLETLFVSMLFMIPLMIPAFGALFPGSTATWIKVLPTYGLVDAVVPSDVQRPAAGVHLAAARRVGNRSFEYHGLQRVDRFDRFHVRVVGVAALCSGAALQAPSCLTTSSASRTCFLALSCELNTCRTVPSRSITYVTRPGSRPMVLGTP